MITTSLHPHVALTGESPVWDPDRNTLWWIDVQGQWLLGWNAETGPTESFPLPSQPGLVALTTCGDLIIGLEDGLWLHSPEAKCLRLLCSVEAEDRATRINDGKPDPYGRLWFGTMEKHGSGAPVGSLYYFSQSEGLIKVREGVGIPNAIATSPDGSRFFFTDSPTGIVESWRLDAERAALHDMSVLATYPSHEKPDGIAIDAEGGAWIAVVGGWRIDRFDAMGSRLAPVEVPIARPTMPAFGGLDAQSVFVTSQRRFLTHHDLRNQPAAGKLARLSVSVAGAPVLRCQI